VILSGFQTHEEREVIAAFRGASLVDRFEEDGWVSVTLRKET
jgi:ribosomal protein L11 methylase PrmA